MPRSWRNASLENLAHQAARWTGSSSAFVLVLSLTLGWMLTGPIYGFSITWQLVMNTVSSATTFVMVFLLQRSQHKDSVAMQLKLSEIIASLRGANNRLISIEDLSEAEIFELRKKYQDLAVRIQESEESSTHSVSTGDGQTV
jgi:low affinity Fe/Cu permease